MIRVLNWDNRLLEWAISQQGEKFEWGKTDCASLASKAIKIIYGDGVEIWGEVAKWKDRISAMRRLKQKQMKKRLSEFGAKEYPISFAQSGDLIVFSVKKNTEGCVVVIRPDMCISAVENGTCELVPMGALPGSAICMRV